MTDVGFQEGVDLYLWAWQPTEPDAGHGGNSSDFAKLEYLGNNIYKKTMVPTQYFNSDVSKFEDDAWPGFWQRLKTKEVVCGRVFSQLLTAVLSSRSLRSRVMESVSSVARKIRFHR